MQAMQSRTASGFVRNSIKRPSIKFAALRRFEDRKSHEVVVAGAPVAEGAGLAHDAANLLGALSVYSDLLAMPGVLHEAHRELAAELRLLSDRSGAMIGRLVNHARVGVETINVERTVLPQVVERCRGVLSRIAGRLVEISYGAGADTPVGIRAEAVERILTNLVKNAAEASPGGGSISVRVDRVSGSGCMEDRVVLIVRDTGCGMSNAAVRRLMQPGGISSGSGRGNGRGLGFRVVRELVAISGGCLNIESRQGVGTTISAEWYAPEAGCPEAQYGEDGLPLKQVAAGAVPFEIRV